MDAANSERIDSWKDISAYLGRDVSTVIRWEKEKGLPVHRIPGGLRQGVFAYRRELESWLAGHCNTNGMELSRNGESGQIATTVIPDGTPTHVTFPASVELARATNLAHWR